MGSNTRKKMNTISEELKRHKRNPRNRTVVNGNTITTAEIAAGEKPGVFIDKDSLINMLKQAQCAEFQLLEARALNYLAIVIP